LRTIKQLMDMSGRTVLITGGAGHIGRVMAQTVAEQGADVVILDRDLESIDSIVDQIMCDYGVKALPLQVNLGNDTARAKVKPWLEKNCKSVDVLINNAAFVGTSNLSGWTSAFEQQSVDTWRSAFEVNLTAVFELTQICADMLKRSTHGSVINVASIYGLLGPDMSLYDGTTMGNPAAYAASKGGMIQLTRWLSTTLSPDVRVNSISPGGVERGQDEVFQQKYVARTPLGRMAGEEDFKGITAYLASDLSAYVTGQNIIVDGGWSVW
jgi:NAD(P)-dependent dehydrogenase (short-subunit alcohol dehydrogenase family)